MENIHFYQGDTVENMKLLHERGIRINKIITSPPYNTVRKNSSDRGYDIHQDGMSNEDYLKWTVDIFNSYDKLLVEDGCIVYNMSYSSENPQKAILMYQVVNEIFNKTNFVIADSLVWKKKQATPNNVYKNKLTRIVEHIFIFVRENEFKTYNTNKKVVSIRKTGQKTYENVFNFIEAKNNDGSCKLNKATYSSDLMSKIFDIYVSEDDVVLDNFSGTGTTALQCYLRGNESHNIELSQDQIDYSINRINTSKKDKDENRK